MPFSRCLLGTKDTFQGEAETSQGQDWEIYPSPSPVRGSSEAIREPHPVLCCGGATETPDNRGGGRAPLNNQPSFLAQILPSLVLFSDCLAAILLVLMRKHSQVPSDIHSCIHQLRSIVIRARVLGAILQWLSISLKVRAKVPPTSARPSVI